MKTSPAEIILSAFAGQIGEDGKHPFSHAAISDSADSCVLRCSGVELDVLPLVRKTDEGTDVAITVSPRSGSAEHLFCGISCDVPTWHPDGYLLVPAVMYHGNRQPIVPLIYPPMFEDPQYHTTNPPPFQTDVYHLETDETESCVELRSGDAAIPCVAGFDPVTRQGFMILKPVWPCSANLRARPPQPCPSRSIPPAIA